jgi:hypothetical protein
VIGALLVGAAVAVCGTGDAATVGRAVAGWVGSCVGKLVGCGWAFTGLD